MFGDLFAPSLGMKDGYRFIIGRVNLATLDRHSIHYVALQMFWHLHKRSLHLLQSSLKENNSWSFYLVQNMKMEALTHGLPYRARV